LPCQFFQHFAQPVACAAFSAGCTTTQSSASGDATIGSADASLARMLAMRSSTEGKELDAKLAEASAHPTPFERRGPPGNERILRGCAVRIRRVQRSTVLAARAFHHMATSSISTSSTVPMPNRQRAISTSICITAVTLKPSRSRALESSAGEDHEF